MPEEASATTTNRPPAAGNKGRNAPPSHRFKVYTAGEKRGVTPAIKRDLRRRAAIEPVIGHLKDDHRMGRNHLAGTPGDAVPAAIAYDVRRLPAWLRILCASLWVALATQTQPTQRTKIA